MPRNPPNSPFLLEYVNPHTIHECLGRPHSPRQTTTRLVHALLHNYATKSPLVTMGCPNFTPKLPLSFDDSHPHLIHPSLDQPHSPPQMASGSSCFATIHCGQTDRPTDWLTDGPGECSYHERCTRYADRERCANNYSGCRGGGEEGVGYTPPNLNGSGWNSEYKWGQWCTLTQKIGGNTPGVPPKGAKGCFVYL